MGNVLSGDGNTVIGANALANESTSTNNTIVGSNIDTNGFNNSVVLGEGASNNFGDNQFVVGSGGTPAGAVGTATVAQSRYWDVIINGVPEQILLA